MLTVRCLVVQETDWLKRNVIQHHRMLEGLSAKGHEVVVVDFAVGWQNEGRGLWSRRQVFNEVSRTNSKGTVTVVRPAMVKLHGLGRLSWLVANLFELTRLVSEFNPDVILAYSISNAVVALHVARRRGIPFVYHVLDALHTLANPPFLRSVAHVGERHVMRRADKVIVLNHGLTDYAMSMGAERNRIVVLPAGVDRQIVDDKTAIDSRAQLGIGRDDVVLFFMGWLYRFSGLPQVIRSLRRQPERFSNVRLLIVGEGEQLPQLRQLSVAAGFERQVLLTGAVPSSSIPSLISAADICLLPAKANETMKYIVPSKIIEYMQQGKPIIATRLPGLVREFGAPKGIMYVDTPEDVAGVVANILEIPGKAPREAATELGKNCLEIARKMPDWTSVIDEFEGHLMRERLGGGATALG